MFRSRWRPSQQAAGPACRGVRACSSAGWERPLACSSLTGVAGVWLEGPRSVTSSQGSSPCPAPSISSFLHRHFGGTSQSSVTCPPPPPRTQGSPVSVPGCSVFAHCPCRCPPTPPRTVFLPLPPRWSLEHGQRECLGSGSCQALCPSLKGDKVTCRLLHPRACPAPPTISNEPHILLWGTHSLGPPYPSLVPGRTGQS